MKEIFCFILLLNSLLTKAQVGIGTANPQATLDVREANPSSPTIEAGIAVPQVNILPSSGNRAGQLIYLTTNNLYYYYDGSSWNPLISQVATIGDVKYGYQNADHSGWILLNGRLKSSLTASQQTRATSLGFGANLSNISDKSIVGASPTKTLNTTGGNATATIAQNQLPNVTLTTSSNGAHTHKAGKSTSYLLAFGFSQNLSPSVAGDDEDTSSAGAHNHTTTSINGNVVQQPLNIQNPYLALNGFIYLGL
jgi:hypothetical protein